MTRFRHGHATHPQWQMALELALAQTQGQATDEPAPAIANLGFLYVTDHYASALPELLGALRQRTGVTHWVGAVAASICASGAEYDDEPALALMMASLPPDSFRMFSGRFPVPAPASRGAVGARHSHTALVHADPALPELAGLVAELSERTATGFLFGALTSGQSDSYTQLADEAVAGGLSGVVFSSTVRLLSRVTQGCTPLAGEHVISACAQHYLQQLDGRPALDVLLEDLGVRLPARSSRDGDAILQALPTERLSQGLFVGLASGDAERTPGFGDYRVRNVVGIDPHNRLLAVADVPSTGDRVVFCTRDRHAARRDLVRILSELRSDIEDEALTVHGALYHSCLARGASLFGTTGVELEVIAQQLGDVPLVGMYGSGEIARDQIYGYTGVLTLFVS